MRLVRIRNAGTAHRVARGVRRFNGVSIGASRILRRPHYAIQLSGRLVGWIGLEPRSRGVFEVCHLSVLPRHRCHGLAEAATRRGLSLLRRWGCRYAYARIRRDNRPSIGLFRKLRFRLVRRGRVRLYGRAV